MTAGIETMVLAKAGADGHSGLDASKKRRGVNDYSMLFSLPRSIFMVLGMCTMCIRPIILVRSLFIRGFTGMQ